MQRQLDSIGHCGYFPHQMAKSGRHLKNMNLELRRDVNDRSNQVLKVNSFLSFPFPFLSFDLNSIFIKVLPNAQAYDQH